MTRDDLVTIVSRVGVIGAIRQGAFDDDGEVLEVTSVTALKGLDTDSIKYAVTSGYSVPGDGGHGVYHFTKTATPPATNNVTIFRSDDGEEYTEIVTNESKSGEWVKATDAIKLQDRIERMQKRIDKLEGRIHD